MKKRGAGHVEIVISYLLFIGFIIFIFYFFNPIKTSKLSESSLPLVFEEISNNITIVMKTYSVKIIGNPLANVSVDLGMNLDDKEVRVENYSDASQSFVSTKSGNRVTFNPGGEIFVLIRVSESVRASEAMAAPGPEGFMPALPTPTGDYEISYVGTREVYSEKKAEALKGEYYSNYPGLKDNLNIQNNDFAFNLTFEDGSLGAARFVPVGIEVYSDYKRREVLRDDGSLAFADLNVKVW